MLACVVNPDGNRGHGDGCVGEQRGGDLVAAAALPVRSFYHRLANHPTNGERDVADDETGGNFKGGVENQSGNRGAHAVEKSTNVIGVAISRQLSLRLLGAAPAGHGSVHAVIGARDGLLAELALVGSRRSEILGGAELNGMIEAGVTHGAER